MEDKKTIKISLSTVICLIIIFILLVALVGVLFYYNFVNKENTSISNELNSSNQTFNTIPNENIENETNTIKEPTISSNELSQQNNIIPTTPENNTSNNKLKIDETKELVYNADYTYGNLAGKSYRSETMEQTYSLDDIIVPYINIDSEDAVKVNKEIKNIFEERAKYFQKNLEANEYIYNFESNYEYYINDNILSIIIRTVPFDAPIPGGILEYYTYNFDLNTKKMLDYEDIYKRVGFSSNNISTKVEKVINAMYNDEDLNKYRDESVQNYNKSVVNNTIKFFLDSSKKLNIIVRIKNPLAQSDNWNAVLAIE